VIDCIADQVQNIPDNLDNLIIPTGSGITAGSILRGIKRYGKRVKNIHVVHISGMDRRQKINGIEDGVPYIYIQDNTCLYNKKVKRTIADGFTLDYIYEAKAYHWMLNNLDYRKEKTLFWCVGNVNYYRE